MKRIISVWVGLVERREFAGTYWDEG